MPAIELEEDRMGGTGGTLPVEEEEQEDDSPSNMD